MQRFGSQVTQRLGALWQQWWPRYRAASRRVQVIIAVVVLVLVCGVCGGLGSALGGGNSASPTPTAVAHVPPTATTAPRPTATHTPSGPRPIAGALLGGKAQDFTAKFGDPVKTANQVRDYQATIAGQDTFVRAMLVAPGDGSRVHFVDVSPNDSTTQWNDATGEAVARTFLPPDAKYVKDVNVPDFGLEHVYQSADLAATFPASSFTDANTGNAVPPGTFYISCGNQDELQGGCSLNLGE